MEHFICRACGTQFARSASPPEACPICLDDRQYVAPTGQAWTTLAELTGLHQVRLEEDAGLLGVGVTPSFAIPQRALLVPTEAGNVLWDCTSIVTDTAVAELERRGGVTAIAISHPHFYSSMVAWSDALGGVPIRLHREDRSFIQRPSPAIELWDGDRLDLAGDARLIHTPGHFPGSCVLHLDHGPSGRPALLAGDSLYVAADRRGVAFVHSVPNHIPMHPDHVIGIRDRLAGVDFDDLYGWTWGVNLIGDAAAKVTASYDRYLAAVGRS